MSSLETTSAHDFSAGVADQSALLREGSVSSRELTEAALERAEASQRTLNPFKMILRDEALAAADEADRRIAAGESGPLLGVPTAVKDDMDIAGHPTAFGCAGDFPPCAEDGGVAKALRAAGAVIIGKTNTPEIGQWSVTAGPAFGITRNPWNTAYTPGGSSGGAAAAVAAGVIGAAVGSDGAGSVRIPAGWTNLVGIKPTRGRVSCWPDREAFNGITAIGPLARKVEDAALLLDALSGSNDPREIARLPAPERPFAAAVRDELPRLRIAVSFKIPFSAVPAKLDPRVRAQVLDVADSLAALGHDVVRHDLNHSFVGVGFVPRSTGGVADWVARVPDRSLLDHRTLENERTGKLLRPALKFARAIEPWIRRRTGRIFNDFDVVLAPTTAKPPLEANGLAGMKGYASDIKYIGACPYAWPWNVLGWPGINVPAGFVEGLPVGAQLLGEARSEPKLIALAAELERERRWHEQRPPGY